MEKTASEFFKTITKNQGFKSCSLTVTELITLVCYTGRGYIKLNRNLRSDKTQSEPMKPFVETLYLALDKLRPYKGVTYRHAILPSEILGMHKVGNIVKYTTHTSTSLDPNYLNTTYHSFIIHSITGRYVGSHSRHYREAEVLFKANTKFKVISREEKKNGLQFVLQEVE